jgi:hypothetical protein
MRWIFSGKLTKRTLASPANETCYRFTANVVLPAEIFGRLRSLLQNAEASVEFMPVSHVAYLIKNWGESHASIGSSFDPDKPIAWLHYDDPHKSLSLVCGFPENQMADFRNLLDEAFFRGFFVSASVLGSFSAVANNPHSKQPTQDEFEIGHPCLAGPVKIELGSENLI